MSLPFWLQVKKNFMIVCRGSRIIIALATIDQITKWWFISYLRWKPGLMHQWTSFLDTVYSWNYGISFGILRNHYQYSNRLFMAVNSVIVCYLYYVMLRAPTVAGFMGYSFVVGGAVGNLIDRFSRGAVFDFIHFHYQEYSFPVFNLADCFISIGVILLSVDYYDTKKNLEKYKQSQYNVAKIKMEAEKVRQQHDL